MPPANNNDLMRYAGLATQFLAGIGLSVFIGLKTDQWLNFKIPLFAGLLPLLCIIAMIYQVFKETTKKK